MVPQRDDSTTTCESLLISAPKLWTGTPVPGELLGDHVPEDVGSELPYGYDWDDDAHNIDPVPEDFEEEPPYGYQRDEEEEEPGPDDDFEEEVPYGYERDEQEHEAGVPVLQGDTRMKENRNEKVTVAVIPHRVCGIAAYLETTLVGLLSIATVHAERLRPDEVECLDAFAKIVDLLKSGAMFSSIGELVIEMPETAHGGVAAASVQPWLDAAGRSRIWSARMMSRRGWRGFGRTERDLARVASQLGANPPRLPDVALDAACLAEFAIANPGLGETVSTRVRLYSGMSRPVVSAWFRKRITDTLARRVDVRFDEPEFEPLDDAGQLIPTKV